MCPGCRKDGAEEWGEGRRGRKKTQMNPGETWNVVLLAFFLREKKELLPQIIICTSKTRKRKQNMTVNKICQVQLTRQFS